MSIGERLHEKREALGLSLEDVAAQLNVHRSTVLRYENGDTKRIQMEVINMLAQILQTTPAYLLGWEESENPVLDPEIRLIARNMQKMPREKRDILIRIINTMSDIADEEMDR